ncbi:Scr1 family TA system antitoxin-like transcriptional regulator [Streptomyces flavidovirens]|uniref:helix-turn-helix domain-containing protein n=1 Tax=Streptomyces flavidovirens TaxID=67298 RepID=UPI00343987C0
MPARSIITARQERLGAELRKLRERAGLTAREASRTTGIAESKISMTEAGRVGVSAERVRHLANQYACDDAALVDALTAMASERVRGWWEEYRELVPPGFLDIAELEHHALHLRTFESVHIPGLLQTEEHARAICAFPMPEIRPEEVETRVRYRMRRQQVLAGDGSLRYTAVIHEAALRVRVADRKAAQRQLLHILEESQRPQVTVRVVPFDMDGFAGIGYPLLYACGPVPQLDTALVETAHGSAFLDAEAQLNRYRGFLSKLEVAALGVVESRDLVHHLVRQI